MQTKIVRTVYAPRCTTTARERTKPVYKPHILEKSWMWKGHSIRYQSAGDDGPPVVLVHGFGGNSDHWRKNLPYLSQNCRTYAIDLIGFGYSDKPDPRFHFHLTRFFAKTGFMSSIGKNAELYTFDAWAKQIADFTEEIVQEPSFLICNSIGGVAGLQTGVKHSDSVRAVQLLNVSLRQLHVRNQSPLARPFIRVFQNFLRDTVAGEMFFNRLARPETIRKILEEAYYDPNTVTDELVDLILRPGLEPGAAQVFLAFISYSTGPLPGELLQEITQPVSIIWGCQDPWERVEDGRSFASLPAVEEFVEIPNGGHCVMCENSEIVNPLIYRFIKPELINVEGTKVVWPFTLNDYKSRCPFQCTDSLPIYQQQDRT